MIEKKIMEPSFRLKLRICDWNNIDEKINYLKNKILKNNSFINPFISLIISDSTYLQKENIENFNLKNNIIKVNNFNINFKKKLKLVTYRTILEDIQFLN